MTIALAVWIGLWRAVVVFLIASFLSYFFGLIRMLSARWISWPLAPGQSDNNAPYPVPLGVFLVVVTISWLFCYLTLKPL